MTSFQQFQANRRNALRSTGPKTDDGKRRSRVNAVRHGLTAETVVGSLEDAEDYKAFEAAIISDYCAELPSHASWCFGSHRCYGAFVAPPLLRPTFLRSKRKLCGSGVLVVPFAIAHSNIRQMVHGPIAARELPGSIKNRTALTISPRIFRHNP